MHHPLIGITSYGRNADNRYTLPAEYVDAVRRAGGIPVILPPGEPHTAHLLPLLDGVILAGGGDIDPARYSGTMHDTIYMLDAERDSGELDITEKLLATQIPMFCICRGLQVLNVSLGGTLIEHLPDVVGEQVAHRMPPRVPTLHSVALDPGSRLAGILGQQEVVASSWHHQAVRDLAEPLKVVATAPDGTIEAVEMPAHPWLIAVQWHPELTAADDPLQQALFDALVNAAKNYHQHIKGIDHET